MSSAINNTLASGDQMGRWRPAILFTLEYKKKTRNTTSIKGEETREQQPLYLPLWRRRPWARGTGVWAWPAWQWRSRGLLWTGWRREALSLDTRRPRGTLEERGRHVNNVECQSYCKTKPNEKNSSIVNFVSGGTETFCNLHTWQFYWELCWRQRGSK